MSSTLVLRFMAILLFASSISIGSALVKQNGWEQPSNKKLAFECKAKESSNNNLIFGGQAVIVFGKTLDPMAFASPVFTGLPLSDAVFVSQTIAPFALHSRVILSTNMQVLLLFRELLLNPE